MNWRCLVEGDQIYFLNCPLKANQIYHASILVYRKKDTGSRDSSSIENKKCKGYCIQGECLYENTGNDLF